MVFKPGWNGSLRDRLLSKIRTPAGDPLEVHKLPLERWPEPFRTHPWTWVGAKVKRHGHISGPGRLYYSEHPERPCFKLDGETTHEVHKLVRKEFFGEPQGKLRYYREGEPNYLDVNPAHWLVPEQQGVIVAAPAAEPTPKPKSTISQEMQELVEWLERLWAKDSSTMLEFARDLYTQEQINEGLALAGLHRYIQPIGGSYVPQTPADPVPDPGVIPRE